MFPFFFNITLCVFLFVFPPVYTFFFITYQSVVLSAFLSPFPLLTYLPFIMIFPFHHAFFYTPMTFKAFTFHFYTHVLFYISPFILYLLRKYFFSLLHLIAFLLLIECVPFCSTEGFVGISRIHLPFHTVLNLPTSHHVSLSAPHYASFFTHHYRSGFCIS